MKKIIIALLLFLCASVVFAQMEVFFFGGNNLTIETDTIFTADLETGATGLLTEVGIGLWFEVAPFADRNIAPTRDVLSVSVKLANSSFFEWRGYDDGTDISINNNGDISSGALMPSMYGGRNQDQATSIWFNTFIAQLEYNQFWMRIAGIEPELTISQASIRTVYDDILKNRTAVDKNPLPLPLFRGDGNHYNGNGGVVGLLARDIVHLNRREVEVAGNFSLGMNTDLLDVILKAGTWKIAEENDTNAWVAGADLFWRPDLSQRISFSFLTAMNYGTVTFSNRDHPNHGVNDPMANPDALIENPVAIGIGYDYRIDLPNRMVLRPYLGFDFLWETNTSDYNFEFGGGLQLFFRGTNASLVRSGLGDDIALPLALSVGANIDRNGLMNAVISIHEDPRKSPYKIGGFLLAEFMNITGKEYTVNNKYEANSYHSVTFNDFMFAGMVQVEYFLSDKLMPYIFGMFIPADMRGVLPTEAPDYLKNRSSVTSAVGLRFLPIKYFAIDVRYTRFDLRIIEEWIHYNGIVDVRFSLKNYLFY